MLPQLIISTKEQVLNYYDEHYSNKNHISRVIFEKIGNEWSIDEIRNVVFMINNAKDTVFMLFDGDMLSDICQNAFLKCIEEHHTSVQIIIQTQSENSLLPTILSRMQIVRLSNNNYLPLPNEDKLFFDAYISNIQNNKYEVFLIQKKDNIQKLGKNSLIYFLNYLHLTDLLPINIKYLLLKKTLDIYKLVQSNNVNITSAWDSISSYALHIYKQT